MITYPTEADLSIQAGDVVRSFDFPDNTQCYIEGVVEDVAGGTYKINVKRRVFSGREVATPYDTVYPPVNGTQGIFGVAMGVTRI